MYVQNFCSRKETLYKKRYIPIQHPIPADVNAPTHALSGGLAKATHATFLPLYPNGASNGPDRSMLSYNDHGYIYYTIHLQQ